LADKIIGFRECSRSRQSQRALYIDSCRAVHLARRCPGRLGDAEDVGNRLGIRAEYGLPRAQTKFKLILEVDGANFGTIAAGVTLLRLYVTRILPDFDLEATGLAGNALDIRERKYFDVSVSGTFDQPGGEYTHSAVAGRKGLVQLGHPAAYCRHGIDQVHPEAAPCQIQ
jgi:hypothetical protein